MGLKYHNPLQYENKMSDDGDDFLLKTSAFIDRHLRIIRAGIWVLAGAGIVIIIRKSYLLKWFKTVSDIPEEFIINNISLRGQVRSITHDNNLGVLHQPLLKTPLFKRHEAEPSSNLVQLSLAGVEFRHGSTDWMTSNVMNSFIHFVPLGRAKDGTELSCIMYKKRKYLPAKVCINEELVRQGLAVAGNTNTLLESNKKYQELFSKLLRAEAVAEKRNRGIWTQPSLIARLKDRIRLPRFLDWRKK